MKLFLFLALLISTQAFALPYVCESEEMDNDRPVLRIKINPKKKVMHNGVEWNHYLIGVTPSEGFRKIVYGAGSANAERIGMTFVKDSFVLGSLVAEPQEDGTFIGEAQIDRIKVTVKCVDEKK